MNATAEPSRPPALSAGRGLWVATAVVFALALACLLGLFTRSPLLYDNDSYYHLAIARAVADEGLDYDFPWARFGMLARGYGDKEILFHAALAPFTRIADPALGGRLALALLGALILAAVGNLALRAIGAWGLVVPFWLFAGSAELAWRMVRLRPELGALVLILLALWAAARRRHRTLGLLALLFALSYTAIHAFVGLFVLLCAVLAWAERRFEWRLLLYPVLGAGLGLLVHPHFPENLAVWWFQAVEFFRLKGALDVGTEIRPNTTDVTLLANLGWWVGLAVLWRSTRRGRAPLADAGRAAIAFGVGAAVFGALYLLMSRFALYFVPLATLALLFEIARRGLAIGGRTRLPGRGSVPVAAAGAVCLLFALPGGVQELGRYLDRVDPGPDGVRIAERLAFSRAMPAGARVAAPWRETALYLYWAPQGRYLNVLDPGFLALGDPDVHRAQVDLFDGGEPDPVVAAAGALASDHVAYSLVTGSDTLTRRLAADPRVEPLHTGIHGLFRIHAGRNAGFVLDWRPAPDGAVGGETEGSSDPAAWPALPRSEDPVGRALEGYVDAARSGPGCRSLVHAFRADRALERVYELAPWGPAELSLDGRSLVRLERGVEAVLGDGALVPMALAPGEHRIEVATCPAGESGRSGFYLLLRRERPVD